MIILGDRYSFSKVEKERIDKRFSTINHISYKSSSASSCIKKIDGFLKSANSKLIVLNTKAAIPTKLLTYLTKLEIQGIRYITIEHFMEKHLHKCLILDESFNIAFLDDIHSYSTFQKIQKRLVDYTAIIMLLIPTLLAIIYSTYKMIRESPRGGLFFRQKRVGLGECEFTCIKLRSMHIDAEKNGAKFATDNDPRAFPWGERLRYTKIDELIQLWNVFKGEMHFVGPRPERKIWTKEFEKSIPYYTQRHIVAPGITGLAQIKYQYGSGKLDAKEKLMYDLYYIKNWNIFLELEIIWKTILFVLTKQRENLSNF
jgi:lipopolysaccharide/colanic/teichoic acid biosynthesis glycosyltransferase